jgi:hypothetical protein
MFTVAGLCEAGSSLRPALILRAFVSELYFFDNVAYVLTHSDVKSFCPLKFFVLRGGQMHKGWLQGE